VTRWKNRQVSLLELYRDPGFAEKLRRFIAAHEADPTILCWHAPDEPSYFGPTATAQQPGYQLIRSLSAKPVWLNVGPSFTEAGHYQAPQEYLEVCEILSEDIYPIPDGQRKDGQAHNLHTHLVGEHTARLVALASPHGAQIKPVWMVLQGFGWGSLAGFKNPPAFVPPTRAELRTMWYDAIVHGATGILSYGPFSTKSPDDARLWDDLKSMAAELRRHYAVLTSPVQFMPDKIRVTVDGAPTGHALRHLIKVLDDRVVVIAVNTRAAAITSARFDAGPASGRLSRVTVLEEDRTVPVADARSWTDSFPGYGVHVYETDLRLPQMIRSHPQPSLPAR
jgi:hypothetical protein